MAKRLKKGFLIFFSTYCLIVHYKHNFPFVASIMVQWNLDLTKSPAGDRPNLFVKWRVRYIENLDITYLRGNDQNVRYIEVIVND